MQFERGRTHRAFTRVELVETVLAALISFWLLFGMILPGLPRERKSLKVHCINNLKHIATAFRGWAREHQDRLPINVPGAEGGSKEFLESGPVFRHFLTVSNYVDNFRILACPVDKERRPAISATNLTDANVSYFLNLDAQLKAERSILAGDRNVTGGVARANNIVEFTRDSQIGWSAAIHGPEASVIALTDGSVHNATRGALREVVSASANPTVRLMFPVATVSATRPITRRPVLIMVVAVITLFAVATAFHFRRKLASSLR